MNILITNHSLSAAGGSEWVVIELALELVRRGHCVAAYSPHLGDMAGLLRQAAIPVVAAAADAPFCPDVIHGQHHLNAMEALHGYPEVPVLYHCHGYVPWVEKPPRHPRILRYAAMCDSLANGLRIELGLPAKAVVTIPNWVDLKRFHKQKTLPRRPARALVFQRSLQRQSWFGKQLESAFQSQNIQLDWGLPQGAWMHPEMVLPEYDIVLAAGRSALEAMACGCLVIPTSSSTCGEVVGPDNFDALAAQNFSPKRSDPWVGSDAIEYQLDRYNSENAASVSQRIRNERSLTGAVERLLGLYEGIHADWSQRSGPSDLDRQASDRATAAYLGSLTAQIREYGSLLDLRRETASLQPALHALQAQVESLQGQLREAADQRDRASQSLAEERERTAGFQESITALKRRLRRRTRQLKAEASQERRGLRLFG